LFETAGASFFVFSGVPALPKPRKYDIVLKRVSFYLGGEKLKNTDGKFFYTGSFPKAPVPGKRPLNSLARRVFAEGPVRPPALSLIALLCLLAFPLPFLSAQEAAGDLETVPESSIFLGDESPAIPPAAPGASVSLILRMLLILLLAAAAIYGVVYFLKRGSRPAEQRDPNVRILSSVHLGSNRFVHVVAVGARVWLLGAGDGGVNLLTEIDDQDAVNALFLEESRRSAQGEGKIQDFKAILRRLGLSVDNRVPGADNIRRRRDRLKGFK
jgi:flagellar protein FliO/FliZ